MSAKRNRITVNVLNNQVNSVSNQYAAIRSRGSRATRISMRKSTISSLPSNRFASQEALLDTVSFGLGVLALGSDVDPQGNNVPVIYAVTTSSAYCSTRTA